jgi:hypothetical protein
MNKKLRPSLVVNFEFLFPVGLVFEASFGGRALKENE